MQMICYNTSMHVALKAYKKDFTYSYTSGVFPTLELLQHKPEQAIRVFLNEKGGDNKGIGLIKEICKEHQIPVEVATSLVIKLSHSENCYAVGVFKKYNQGLEKEKKHVVLVNPSDMGNVGTIIRTMVGFGMHNLAVIKPAVDVFDPKVIRSSTGSFFQANISYFSSFEEYITQYPQQQLYTFMLDAQVSLPAVKFEEPFSLVFGNEGAGLPKEFLHYGTSVIIPHSKNIDSLNLSMSVGITLYEACKKNF